MPLEPPRPTFLREDTAEGFRLVPLDPAVPGEPPPGWRWAEPDDDATKAFGPPSLPPRRWRWRWFKRALLAAFLLFIVAVGWLAWTAPLSKSLQPPAPPRITLLASDGVTPIARTGAVIGASVDAARLPKRVTQPFLAIEDRRFYSHWGIDPIGIARAMMHNVTAGGVREGGSTITQQLAKNAFLDSDRTAGRKLREVLIAFWLEAWLTKDEILSRYLSNVYFGDNVYGLSAAAKHYFGVAPDKLTTSQAAMLAGLVKAPSRLAPTGNIKGAQAREKVVLGAMADAGMLTTAEARATRLATVVRDRAKPIPDGSYFSDWVLPEARDRAGAIASAAEATTTLDRRLQVAAERAARRAGLRQAQVAIVAMHPDGRVVAMVGGKDYRKSPFNRATQARRQPGSAFKLFVYLAALRSGLTPDSTVLDEPVEISGWKPHNADGRYQGEITLRQAFAKSSNVAAARLTQQVGVDKVIRAARDLGISTPIPNEATIALGTSSVSLLELTAAYAAVARQAYPVSARGFDEVRDKGWYDRLTGGEHPISGRIHDELLDLLSASAETGTGRQAALSIRTYGKTGTTQDSRDALFVGFAGDLVVGVWVGNDDNTPNAGLSVGGIPARIWRDFMQLALGVGPKAQPVAEPDNAIDPDADNTIDGDDAGDEVVPFGDELRNIGIDLRVGHDGSVEIGPSRPARPAPEPETRAPPPDRSDPDDQ